MVAQQYISRMGHWIFYAGYGVSVPGLVLSTDPVVPKRNYLLGVATITISTAGFVYFADDFYSVYAFRFLWGWGWAGTYMPGLKALSDIIEGPEQSRAASADHALIFKLGHLMGADRRMCLSLRQRQHATVRQQHLGHNTNLSSYNISNNTP